jgi:hypothetical protein
MPIHDTYARVTPYELILPTEGFPGERFPLIQQEAEERGGSVITPDSFLLLSQAALALREIRGEQDPAEALQQHGALLYHAFHFWDGGETLFLLGTDVLRFLVENGPEAGDWTPSLPGGGGYVQVPQHLVWTGSAGGEGPESLDGLFWAAPDGRNLSLLIATGMRKDRPGLSVIPLPTLPLEAAASWASMNVRAEGQDFESDLPGAEMERLYSIEAGGEAVKLAMRVFWYLDVFPGRVMKGIEPEAGMEGPGGSDPRPTPSPRPSRLAYRRVILGEG